MDTVAPKPAKGDEEAEASEQCRNAKPEATREARDDRAACRGGRDSHEDFYVCVLKTEKKKKTASVH